MSSAPLFSIIIPTFNRANLLKKAVQSVLDQTFPNWELIIVDDGSSDNTRPIIQAYTDRRIRYFFQEHQERSTARNFGISHASGRYVCFMDDDDYILEHHLQVFFDALSKDGFPVKIYRNGFYFEKGNKRTKGPVYDPELHPNPVYFAAFNFCSAWSLCIPKVCLKDQLFPEAFPYWEDTHLILRLLIKYTFQQNNNFTYIYQLHPDRNSQLNYRTQGVNEKVVLNVEAIRHFFLKYGKDFQQLLPQWTEDFLIAEKYLGYANNALLQRAWKRSISFFFTSIRASSLHFLTWQYFKYILKLPLKFFFNIPG
ncbi:MAG: glycosyltransferase family 2 protein [Lewinellaceae bacterium]|nr:glycosyltransferase family 2 protein [Lewinellaceae bacterium]